MFRKIASVSSPFIAYLVIAALLVLPGALAQAQTADFFSYAVITLRNVQPPSEGSWHVLTAKRAGPQMGRSTNRCMSPSFALPSRKGLNTPHTNFTAGREACFSSSMR